jgi:MtN3 and saliva related transmembrane protein
LAAVLTAACWLPQVVKTMRLGEASDFAWPYLAMLVTGVTLWTIYGIARSDGPLWVCNLTTGLFVLVVVAVKRRQRLAPQGAGHGAP